MENSMMPAMLADPQTAPVLLVFGQSNAHGHGTLLPAGERMSVPLKNVWGLDRRENQRYGLRRVTWSGYTSGGMNLGETQDHTCCLATEFTRLWQRAVDAGRPLCDLYIVQISIGGQGIAEQEKNGCNMWYPRRRPVLVPGDLAHVDISLYPLAMQILPLVFSELRQRGKKPVVLGLHWNQWETEADTGGRAIAEAPGNYRALFDGFRRAVQMDFPIYLYQPLSGVYHNPEGVAALCRLFAQLSAVPGFELIDLSRTALWAPGRDDRGIFQEDLVHYSCDTHRWFARYQWKKLFGTAE